MEKEFMEQFVATILKNHEVWMLQADDGLFALLEGADEQNYIPLWSVEAEAKRAANKEWFGYQTEKMELKELLNWLKELDEDHLMVGISLNDEGRIIPFQAMDFKRIVEEHWI